MNFKRCSTVAALLMASAIPAFAQEGEADATVELVLPSGVFRPELVVPETVQVPADSILLNIQGTQTVYAVPYATAADLCDVEEADLVNLVAQGVDLIYCEELEEAILTSTEGVMPMEGFEDGDDDDDDGDSTDDAEETAEDEANDEDGDGIFDEDDNDTEEEGPGEFDDSADGEDGEGDNADGADDMDAGDDMDGSDNMDDDVNEEAEAGADSN